MKLARVGNAGAEKPAVVDRKGQLRDISSVTRDIDGAALAGGLIGKLASDRSRRAAGDRRHAALSARPIAGVGKFICIGLNYSDHAAETGAKPPTEPILFMKATSAISAPNDPLEIPRGSAEDRLGGRTRRRHRQAREIRVAKPTR